MSHRLLRLIFTASLSLILFTLSSHGQLKKPAGFQGKRLHFVIEYNLPLSFDQMPYSLLDEVENQDYSSNLNFKAKHLLIGQGSARLNLMLNRKTSLFTEYGRGKYFYVRKHYGLPEDQALPDFGVPIFQLFPIAPNSSANTYVWGDVIVYNYIVLGLKAFKELGPISWSFEFAYMPVFFRPESDLYYSEQMAQCLRLGLSGSKILYKNLTISGGLLYGLNFKYLSEDNPKYTNPFASGNPNTDVAIYALSGLNDLMLARLKVGFGYLF